MKLTKLSYLSFLMVICSFAVPTQAMMHRIRQLGGRALQAAKFKEKDPVILGYKAASGVFAAVGLGLAADIARTEYNSKYSTFNTSTSTLRTLKNKLRDNKFTEFEKGLTIDFWLNINDFDKDHARRDDLNYSVIPLHRLEYGVEFDPMKRVLLKNRVERVEGRQTPGQNIALNSKLYYLYTGKLSPEFYGGAWHKECVDELLDECRQPMPKLFEKECVSQVQRFQEASRQKFRSN